MNALKVLLFPVTLVYGLVVAVRNFCYDSGILKSREFPIHNISIGNLSVGGTGKTPHIEYLIRLLKDEFKLATLSRGYGRQSTGFVLATRNSSSREIGDEPRQYIQKFDDIIVSVDANRIRGMNNLMKQFSDIKVVLLDDAFQHRALKPELSIVLFDYNNPYYSDRLLPIGKLREFRNSIKRADIIIVSKGPEKLSPYDRRNIELAINAKSYQKIYFSYIKYLNFKKAFKGVDAFPEEFTAQYLKENNASILLLAGVANPTPLEDYLRTLTSNFSLIKYPDHHKYNQNDISRIKKQYELLPGDKKIIVTTEKDYSRLDSTDISGELHNLPIYYLPIEIEFQEKDKEEFNQQIIKYARRNKIYVGVYKEKN